MRPVHLHLSRTNHRVANPWALVSNHIYKMTWLYWGTIRKWCSLGAPGSQSWPKPLFQNQVPIKYLFVSVVLSLSAPADRISPFEVVNPPCLD